MKFFFLLLDTCAMALSNFHFCLASEVLWNFLNFAEFAGSTVLKSSTFNLEVDTQPSIEKFADLKPAIV